MGNLAKVNPEILIWARDTAKMSIESVASKMKVSEVKIEKWEKGESFPTIKKAQKLAKIYRRPFALFFFPEMPEDFHPLRDFRRKTSTPLQTASVFIIREIQQKQAWMRENLIDNQQDPLPFVGKFSIEDDPVAVAKHILDTLEIDPSKTVKNKLPLNYWIDKVQKAGINVSRSSYVHTNLRIDPEELQGFAIVDPHAPFVFINSKDWKSPQLFTLVHELAHIWIGESGISNEIACQIENKIDVQLHPVELFCSEVSANVLMPEDLMKSITKLDYNKVKAKNSPIYYPILVNKNGKLFIQTVLNAYRTGEIEVSQASYLLNVKAGNLSKLEEQAFR
jgi:Zn-dependent peptidase ImmA (M78 family)/transcriptional regulator with XRE-family HTH domain